VATALGSTMLRLPHDN